MKEILLQLIAERHDICLTSLPRLMPEIKGDYSMYLPVKHGYNPNILMLGNVSQEFIKAFNELEQAGEIVKEPVSVMIPLFDGATIYDLPIVKNTKQMRGNKEKWIPMIIKLGTTEWC